ncbi:MAG: efflux RND transporter periplasmic adaptor subunit [Desulfobacterales bacterium]|nr:efflux RND transporter periplasmic adaptor subunit [Desulfobacterales bacterium]
MQVGQPCEIRLDAFPDARFPGRVHMILPTADRSQGLGHREGRLPRARPARAARDERQGGLPGAASPQPTSRRAFTAVPGGGRRPGGNGTERCLRRRRATGRARRRVTGRAPGRRAWSSSGRARPVGTRVATGPADRLRDGARVSTAKQ